MTRSPHDDDAPTVTGTSQPPPVGSPDDEAPLPGLTLAPGQRLGSRYTIIKMLGRGGMGAVYQAWDDELNVSVAIKTILPGADRGQHATHAAEEGFKRELLLARQVTHKNVVRIHDLGDVEGHKYITMAFVEGETLGRLLKRGELPIAQAVTFARQIADGLAAAHEVGIVHRDLKPENVMITPDGHALIMDFGIARGGTNSTSLQAGTIAGTLEYMAPEQASGQAIDHRADIYAFGLIVYDMLLGRQRMGGRDNPMSELLQRAQRAPEPPRTTRAEVPAALEHIVMRCVQPDVAARPATTQELVDALSQLAHDGHVRKETAVPARRTATIALAAGVALLVAIAAGGSWYMSSRTPSVPAGRPAMSLLIANFENHTSDSVFDGLVEHALGVGVESAAFINTMPRRDALRAAAALPGGSLSPDNARLIALREGVDIVIAGAITLDNGGYWLTARAVAGKTTGDHTLFETRERASSKDDTLAAVGRLAAGIRNQLGDVTVNSTNVRREDTFTARSLEAARAYALGQDRLGQGKYDEAITAYRRAVELDPELARAWSGLGTALANLGRRDEAEAPYAKALALIDRVTERERLRIRGGYYLFAGNGDKAREEYEQLVKQFPGDPSATTNLAVAYFRRREFDRASDVGRVAAELFAGNPLRRTNVALYAMYAGKFEDALRQASDIAQSHPQYLLAHVAIAMSQTALGHYDRAQASYRTLRTLSAEGHARATIGLADIALLRGRPSEAIAELEPAIASEPSASRKARLLATLAEARLAQGHAADAAKLAQEVAQMFKDLDLQYTAGRVLVDTGRPAAAAALAQLLANKLDAESQMAGHALEGEILLARQDARGAIENFQQAIRAADSWLARYGLARAYLAAGAFAEADSELDRCLRRRGEATALFLDDIPTWRVIAPLYYYQGLTREGLHSSGATESFKTFLAFKDGGDEKTDLVADVRKRLQ